MSFFVLVKHYLSTITTIYSTSNKSNRNIIKIQNINEKDIIQNFSFDIKNINESTYKIAYKNLYQQLSGIECGITILINNVIEWLIIPTHIGNYNKVINNSDKLNMNTQIDMLYSIINKYINQLLNVNSTNINDLFIEYYHQHKDNMQHKTRVNKLSQIQLIKVYKYPKNIIKDHKENISKLLFLEKNKTEYYNIINIFNTENDSIGINILNNILMNQYGIYGEMNLIDIFNKNNYIVCSEDDINVHLIIDQEYTLYNLTNVHKWFIIFIEDLYKSLLTIINNIEIKSLILDNIKGHKTSLPIKKYTQYIDLINIVCINSINEKINIEEIVNLLSNNVLDNNKINDIRNNIILYIKYYIQYIVNLHINKYFTFNN